MSRAASCALERGSIRWYWNRLRVMEALELPHRAATALANAAERALASIGGGAPVPRLRSELPAPWLAAAHQLPEVDAAPCLAEADRMAEGLLPRLDGQWVDVGAMPDWARCDPARECSDPAEDVRHAMELHRHGHLVRLAQAWRLGGDERHLAALYRHLDAWLEQCPFPHGVAWASALDAALRLINWAIVWQLLDGARNGDTIPPPLRKRWVSSIYIHARFIRKNKSRYSSANNHLIGELVSLVVAEATWPLWPKVLHWGEAARRALYSEAMRQVHPDGTSAEQASWYQGIVFELLALFVHIERSRGHPVDERLLRRLSAMARFAAALPNRDGQVSHHGDTDGAHALALGERTDDALDRVLSLAVALDVAPELRPLLQRPGATASWLVGGNAHHTVASEADRIAARSGLPRAFPAGGYYLLGRRFGAQDEVMMTLDAGPLGYLGVAAHGHADALSVRLSVAGRSLLVDRGTFAYNTQPAWRRFFRGTMAHNTVCVDGADQSEYGGPFLWLRKAQCVVTSFTSADSAGHLDASHDGYRHLHHSVLHRRRVDWHGASSHFIVADTLVAHGAHQISVAWHFDPQCVVTLHDGLAVCRSGNVSLQLRVQHSPAPGHWTLHQGDTDSMLGWHSPSFGVRVAAPTLVWHASIQGPATFVTRIDIQPTEEDTRETKNSGL